MSQGTNAAKHDLPLVDHPDGITPRWLSDMLKNNGIDAEVKGFRHSPVGTGQMADNYRLHLDYSAKPEGAPDSVVVKVSSANEKSRASGGAGAYITEVQFYLNLAEQVAIRTPRCYHGDIAEDNHVFVLVLEDLAPAEQGDQIRGCSPEEAKLALENLAGLHGSSWNDPNLDSYTWLSRVTPDVAKLFASVLVPATEGFIDRYQSTLDKVDVEVLRTFSSSAEGWLAARPDLFAPVHGDYRLDNLMFGTAAGGAPVAAVDWQTLSIGHPGRDVAYFLGNAMPSAQRREHEQELVRAYYDALVGQGVANYSFEECFDDYRYGHFQGPLVTVLGAMAVLQTDRGDEMFMAMCSRSCQAIRDLDSLSFL
ncbi:MAG: aminoglycoside/choline kinase family phosphotransferase [Myxococcota bacterium]|jgi:aminoglycoside/choline kinase family phosphotransferase